MTPTTSPSASVTAVDAPTQLAESNGRRLAYRSLGNGEPIVLCNRFRGILDTWDPAFLDGLARSFNVITFDYSGLGRSTGDASYDPRSLAKDAIDLADALGLDTFIAGGWSLGGLAAQTLVALHPDRVSHAVLIGTGPPGAVTHPAEQIFYDTALKPVNDLADETILFFEPLSESSRTAARESHDRIAARTQDLSVPIPPEVYMRLLTENAGPEIFPDRSRVRDFLSSTTMPVLVISGDHDIVFPIENWFALVRSLPTTQVISLPRAGHGPQHQFPAAVVDYITTFIRTTK
jgi:pimeloyl-ACP methyl ester carboxylesterase